MSNSASSFEIEDVCLRSVVLYRRTRREADLAFKHIGERYDRLVLSPAHRVDGDAPVDQETHGGDAAPELLKTRRRRMSRQNAEQSDNDQPETGAPLGRPAAISSCG